MTIVGCQWHPSRDNIGVCALCLRESLSRLAVYQEEEEDSIDLEISPPSKPLRGPTPGRRAQYILVRYDEDVNTARTTGSSSKSFYTGGDGASAMGASSTDNDNSSLPYDRESSYFSLDAAAEQAERQVEASTSDDSGTSGGQTGNSTQNMPSVPETLVEPNPRSKPKKHASSGQRKPKTWGAAIAKMVGLRTLSVLWRSERKGEQSTSLEGGGGGKPASADRHQQQQEHHHHHLKKHKRSRNVPELDQEFTPARFSVSSVAEQTTPVRFSVSSQLDQTTPTMSIYDHQITPARFSGASLFDIESADSRTVSTSSRGSPFTAHKPIHGDDFNAAWRANRSGSNARRMGAFEGFNELQSTGRPMETKFTFPAHVDGSHDDGCQDGDGGAKKTPWRWFSPFRGASRREERKECMKAPIDTLPVTEEPYQERRKSTSALVAPRWRDQIQHQTLTPKLSGKKSPWWRASPVIRALKSPQTNTVKVENRDQEVAISTDSDLMEDTPHRLSTASPLVGYSRSSSNGSSCFTTPRWNTKQRSHHRNQVLGVHEMTPLAI